MLPGADTSESFTIVADPATSPRQLTINVQVLRVSPPSPPTPHRHRHRSQVLKGDFNNNLVDPDLFATGGVRGAAVVAPGVEQAVMEPPDLQASLSPLASRLSPLASRLSPLASRLSLSSSRDVT